MKLENTMSKKEVRFSAAVTREQAIVALERLTAALRAGLLSLSLLELLDERAKARAAARREATGPLEQPLHRP